MVRNSITCNSLHPLCLSYAANKTLKNTDSILGTSQGFGNAIRRKQIGIPVLLSLAFSCRRGWRIVDQINTKLLRVKMSITMSSKIACSQQGSGMEAETRVGILGCPCLALRASVFPPTKQKEFPGSSIPCLWEPWCWERGNSPTGAELGLVCGAGIESISKMLSPPGPEGG